ncbi:protein of unknown function [Methanocaldococcus lauensis]|uniref:Uncharacterized protein n=1 Tax=Methanocaldococcus lauensis TaxID=2546128 RepID=A0A8D6STZ4_9EURY|nr:protein of unknown function [Methanocaldococcus lauensis]
MEIIIYIKKRKELKFLKATNSYIEVIETPLNNHIERKI